jgi:hypothetical protein
MKEHVKQDNQIIIKSNEINNYISIKIIHSPFDHKIEEYESYGCSERGTKVVICVKNKPLITIPSALFPSLETIAHERKDLLDSYEHNQKKNLKGTIFRRLLSNLIIWSENNYNTQLIDCKIAFPLLKELREVGETKFQIILQQEILKAYATNTSQVKEFLKREGYLKLICDFF